jgi:hypothetical protein
VLAEKADLEKQLAAEQTEREKAQRAMEKAQAAEQKRYEREAAVREKEAERREREAAKERKSWINWWLKNVGGKVITQVLRGVLGGRKR